ncbi:virulence factor TspB C-terminal domain-related protein [Cupriavidus basilensis]
MTSGIVSGWNAVAFNSGLTTQVAGKAVTVPAVWRLASNAADFAVTALRLNPVQLAAGVALTWAASYGLQYLNDQWLKVTPGQPASQWGNGFNYQCSGAPVGPISVAAATQCGTAAGWAGLTNVQIEFVSGSWRGTGYSTMDPGNKKTIALFSPLGTCPAGTTDVGGTCTTAQTSVAATDADFQAMRQASLDNALASWFSGWKVSLPVNPEVNPSPLMVPLSDPYLDPVTGKRYKDMATITPSATNPKTAELQTSKQEVDPVTGDPVRDASGVAVAPQKQDNPDPCTGHEKRLGCMELDDPPQGPDLQASSKTISITPDSGWGADTMACPADLTSTLRTGGTAVAFSFKPACDGADMFRPVIIAMAWVGAVLIALGVGRKGD